MVPLVQKQISIDSSSTSSSTFMTSDGLIDDNGSYQESMKTIKKGQASSLSRCSSFKITPVTATTQNTGELEKSISTQSLHTTAPSTSTGSAPSLVRHNSTPIFRFKVSPSSYKPPAPAPVAPLEATVIPTVIPMETTVTPESTVDVTPIDQMPSTSSASEDVVKKEESDDVVKKPKKSSLREPLVEFPQRDDYGAPRARKIRFSGLDVHYFDRLQGSLTVPKEGCVTLAMHPRHHTHRHFSLASGRRPPLNLELYEDGELSEDEVIHPDDVEEIEEIQTTKHMDPIEPKQRIQILKKSGVKLEKNGGAAPKKHFFRI
ncbi:hypothetical protein CRE_15118 [Caenorhabditis remanei]|uniref:Cysteine/serine-rich nuclear protein N-terminal domain-containing protein n=1 Tax=Caenorhabditis remanei TaxID=31234 RepID=E3NQ13_CAERE|nr:hypothetical protein CRE_15118 [Caenorhabditis remanei]